MRTYYFIGREPLQCIQHTPDGKNWRLICNFVVQVLDHHYIIVPAGFITDFASIPWFCQWRLSKLGPYNESAVVHDYLYVKIAEAHYHRTEFKIGSKIITWYDADQVFLRLMRAANVGPIRRRFMYYGVRSYSWVGLREWSAMRTYKKRLDK